MNRFLPKILRMETALAVLTLGAAAGGWLGVRSQPGRQVDIGAIRTTVGDVQVLHADVTVRGRDVRGSARLDDGDDIKTGDSGRARLRLDDGTIVVVDARTDLSLRGERLTLARGRIFVQGGTSARTEVALGGGGGGVVTVVASAAAFEAGSTAKAYCARGELVVAAGGKTPHVASGETATFAANDVKVAPETAFDDWTGGLAAPWSGEKAPASAIAELWGENGPTEPGAPLVVRTEKVDVTIEGEVALTRTRTTYFNGSDRNVKADVRMALPEGAIVSRVARLDEGGLSEHEASIGASARNVGNTSSGSGLEWAGGGWVRGTLADVGPGKTVDLFVDWIEWLPERDGRATYRFPMASTDTAPMVGGLSVRVTSQSPAQWLSASSGAQVTGGGIELHKADLRPTGDLVVELVPEVTRAGAARAYVQPGRAAGQDGEDPYLIVRTEVPDLPPTGVTLALVVDTSSSAGTALLETERAAVDALLESLGPKDSVVVLAADQDTRVIGPDKPAPVTPELRARIGQELGKVQAAGASNLGLGLERAADLLDAQESSSGGMVVYLGDGHPTVGEATARDIRQRLSRRQTGVPRLGAIAVGQGADRWMLAELVAGAGPVYEVLDRPDAARAGAALVAEALTPSLRDVSIVLGPTVDRIYPRDARTARAGSTITVAGRLRGAPPKQIGLRYRRGTELVEETRPLQVLPAPTIAQDDVSRRWAEQRIEESILHAPREEIEPSIALAQREQLLTPWTGWFFNGNATLPWADRVLDLSPSLDVAFASKVEPAPAPPSLLSEPPRAFDGEDTIEEAAIIAARHAIEGALAPMVACRDARASVKPGVGSFFHVAVSVAAGGRATNVTVRAADPGQDDAVLDRCLRVVVDSVPFFDSGVAIRFEQTLTLPPAPSSSRSTCSVASTLPLPVRRGIWRARRARNELDYASAARACELPTWSDRRTLLGILVADLDVEPGITLVQHLSELGETDAAAFVRQELLHQAQHRGVGEAALRKLLVDDEPKLDRALDAAYRAAKTDAARLAVLRRFLRLAPHTPLGRRLLLALLEATGDKPGLLETIGQIQNDAVADAGLLAECASALRRIGLPEEGRRAFGDLVERAPRDPWTLAYVGDRLRAEGLYEDALASYERLGAVMPDDPAVALRLALAHAGAGRLDVATRLLDRVSQTGGRGDDGRLGELASIVSASLLAAAHAKTPRDGETDALLLRRLAQTPLPDVASLILVRSPLTDDPVQVSVARQVKDKDDLPADLDAASMGLAAVRIERGSGPARIRLHRAGLTNGRPVRALVTALLPGPAPRLVSREVDIGLAPLDLTWTGTVFQ
jgi:tetratricopeptide (TPR) repeat protein